MTDVDTRYHNQTYVTRGVAIFTDAMRALIRRELEARDGAAWWDRGVWPWLSESQRNAIIESRANDADRAPEDFLDTSHFRAIMVDPDTNYPVFAQYLPSRTQARRAMETARQAKNLLVSHRRSGDTPTGAVIAALQAMHQLLELADVSAAEELAHLRRSLALQGDAPDAQRASRSQPSERCAICAQPVPDAAIVLERGVPRHVTARAFAAACQALFGAPVCAEHLRQLDPENTSVLDGIVIGHNRGGLIVDVAGIEGFVPRRHTVVLRGPLFSEADTEALLARQRGRPIRLQLLEQGQGRRPVFREVHPDESLVLDVDRAPRCRALNFPASSSLGTVHLHSSPPAEFEASHNRRPATGVVIVPASSFAWLDVDPNADLDQLIALGDLALDGIKLRGQAVDDSVVLRVSHIESLQYVELSGTAVTDEGVQALARSGSALRVSRTVEPDDGKHTAASLNVPGTDDNESRERRRALLDAFGLVSLAALLALFAVQGIRSRPGDAGLWATWAVIVAPVVTSWCLKPRRPRYLEAFWVGGVFGGLVVALWVLASWRGPPLDSLDMAGPAVAVLASITVAVGLGWTIRQSPRDHRVGPGAGADVPCYRCGMEPPGPFWHRHARVRVAVVVDALDDGAPCSAARGTRENKSETDTKAVAVTRSMKSHTIGLSVANMG